MPWVTLSLDGDTHKTWRRPTRSRPFANKFSYARDVCHGTSIHPASVKAVFEPGKSQKADGLTKVLAGALMKTFVSDLGLAPLTR